MDQRLNKSTQGKESSEKEIHTRYSLRNIKEPKNIPQKRKNKSREYPKRMSTKGKQSEEREASGETLGDEAQTTSGMPELDYDGEEREEADYGETNEEEEEMMNELGRVRRALGLQMEGLFGTSGTGRFRTLLNNLKNEQEPTMQLLALQELAEVLSVSNEDNLVGYFSCDSFVKELVRLMSGPETFADMDEDMMLALAMSEGMEGGNPEMMLLACRCISNLLDAMPTAATSIVFHGGIKVLCQKLKSIQYIDLAEQALCALEKIAAQVPRAVVHEGGLGAALMYFDFFSVHAQRTALRTASSCLRSIDPGSFGQVTEITPTLMNAMQYSDRTVVELTCVCWVRIAESFRGRREALERVVSVELLQSLFGLIPVSGNTNAARPSTFQDILRILRAVAKTSPKLSFELLQMDILGVFYQILTGQEVPSPNQARHPPVDPKWTQSIPVIIKTMADLFPSLPKDGMFSSRRFKENGPVASRTRSAAPSESELAPEKDPRIGLFEQDPAFLVRVSTALFPLFLDLYASTVNVRVRQLVTYIMLRLIYYTHPKDLQAVLENVALSSFLSGVLARQEQPGLILDALYHAELLIKKLPGIYHVLFEREGVFHEIELLARLPLQEHDSPQPDTESDATTNTDAEKKPEDEDEGEEEDENEEDEAGADDPKEPVLASRRLLERTDFQAILRGRYGLLQPTRHRHEPEKGAGKGSVRKHIIHLAQYFVNHYFHIESTSPGNSLKEISGFAHTLHLSPKDTLTQLSLYLQNSLTGISSFELLNSGLVKALHLFLTQPDPLQGLSLQERTLIFRTVFENAPLDSHGTSSLHKLLVRLHQVLSQSETFEVVTPLESSSSDGLRNPTSMLAKQLRIRLTAQGEHVPATYKQLMVSTHAVATFRILEEYLLARIPASLADTSDDEEQEQPTSLLFSDEDHMDLDPEDQPMTEPDTTQKEGRWKIQFSLEGDLIHNDTTVYAAVHKYELQQQPSRVGRSIWSASYPITFERIWVPATEPAPAKKDVLLQPEPKEAHQDSTCTQALLLMKALSPLVDDCTGIQPQDFINRKLTAKMNRQLEEPLIVASACLPSWTYWLMSTAPFLFPFETRYLFIQSTSFGYSRLISRWQSLQMRNNSQSGPRDDPSQQPILGRTERQKVRIVRSQMLESAIKIFDLFGSSPGVLEIEYVDEEGTGLGPTLEFYASTSKEFTKHALNLWLGSEPQNQGYLFAPQGLFPKPLPKTNPKSAKKIVQLFRTLGQFLAKAMLDFRIIDIGFSPAFFQIALEETKPSQALLSEIDPVLAKSLDTLYDFIQQKKTLYADKTKSNAEKIEAIDTIQVKGAKLQDLCLDFTLPGDPSYELKPGGADIPVTIKNVESYVEAVIDVVAGSGIAQQVEAFKEGFNGLFAIKDLKLLTYPELVSLFGTSDEDWSMATLADAIKADHGFNMESKSVQHLLEILSKMDVNQKREFLQFTTGSPRLPIGGWKALRPVFTVVRKIPESTLSPDDYLPSVMTCANYLKMPEYSTKEIMEKKLEKSIKEGQNSFLLS